MDTALARQLLDAESRRLAEVHDLARAHLRAGSGGGEPRDPVDLDGAGLASDLLEAEIDEALLHAVADERADVAHALARLDDGGYGTCEACRSTIPDERLEALPAARFCLTCEVRGELDEAGRRAPDLDPGRRAALGGLDDWADDGDTGSPAAEEGAMHAVRPGTLGSP